MAKIQGAFTGFHGDAVFRLTNGQVWQQARYAYRYRYAYRPEVEIRREGGRYVMHVPCMNASIEVARVSIVEEGTIVSSFKGFHKDAEFVFNNRHVWKQAEYQYDYHYAHRPDAIVVDGRNGLILHVEGMSDTVQVRRIR